MTLPATIIDQAAAPTQTLPGVNEPDIGYILDDVVLPDSLSVPRSQFFTAAAFVHPGDTATATICGLGAVSVAFT